ncbi:MAG: bifunctional UDP-N-acetylglucosamine diphosphorylase/glucosamine-1-phosphate N-acetyltransferase GlmU [Gammaproteobacteria bacterium]|nr:bifunctional UDP-N-acetylglucosamine diphosphorylase/glucosamine-1-phosphate N-acetyltransferase GlmU [Gammaproteobacteria bacterium]
MHTVILAAGQGTRMRSDLPKVLQPLAGRPLLAHVLDTARELAPAGLHVVYGHGGERVPEALGADDVAWVHQAEQLGTGHAVVQALPGIGDEDLVLVLYGDVPLITAATLESLLEAASAGGLALLTVILDDPTGYGRIVRDPDGRVVRIVEEKDATADERAVREVNTGILAAPAFRLRDWLGRVGRDNSQGEYYLTDVVALAVADGCQVVASHAAHAEEVLGVNTKAQLAQLERHYQRALAGRAMDEGATLADPARFDLRGTLDVGRDVFIDVGVILEGAVTLGDGVHVGPHCVLRDARVGAGSRIEAYSLVERAEIGRRCSVGPYARLRPETVLGDDAKVGNFVETKKARIGEGSKVNHLSYVGDTVIGRESNIGAGTITCNYDGHAKHPTRIGDRVFIGSDTQLVAPVSVGDGATVGAGTTVTRDVPAGSLAVSRAPQRTVADWRRPGTPTDEEG